MSDTNNSEGDNKLRLKAPRRIVLKKTVEGGTIKQNFSHGRSKSVVVEVRRKKSFVNAAAEEEQKRKSASADGAGRDAKPPPKPKEAPKQHILEPLSPEERAKRLQAKREAEAQAKIEAEAAAKREAEAAEQAKIEAEETAKREAEAAEQAKIAAEEAAKIEAEETAKREAEEAAKREAEAANAKSEETVEAVSELQAEEEPAAQEPEVAQKPAAEEPAEEMRAEAPAAEEPEEEMRAEEPPRNMTKAQREDMARKKTEDLVSKRLAQLEELREQKRRDDLRQKEIAANATRERTDDEGGRSGGRRKKGKRGGDDSEDRTIRMKGGKRGRRDKRSSEQMMPTAPIVREVIIPETITVGELANRMAVKSSEVIKNLFSQGMMVTINQTLDQDTATLLVEEMGHKPKAVSEAAAIEEELGAVVDTEETLMERPPIITVMGHVDHGKTSLLDAIRSTDVTSREHGGITQHIGAYQVTLESGKKITFLDTPGHAAFTAMRARGAHITDIVVLVVAADDGVMPQTIEAISHAKSAGAPIVVAVNKMDKPEANPDRVMQQLTEYELVPEDWGGDTIFCKLSAKSGDGVAELEEMLLLQAEILNLRANPDNERTRGVIVEANLDRGRGAVATCLIENGTLRVGDICVVGHEWGRVRGLTNDKGDQVSEALPAMPVEIIGLSGVPLAGDELVVVPDERRAREIADFRVRATKEKEQAKMAPAKLDDIFDQISQGEVTEVKVVIKADVQGSVEAVADALTKIKHDEVAVKVIHTGVGGINESDVMLAVASEAIVLGFNVRADAKGRDLAKREGVDMRFYNVIYDLVDDITQALEGQLAPKVEEKVLGHAQVREVFRISKVGNVAGCLVTDGIIQKDAFARLLRDNVVIYEGPLSALKRFKDDVKEVREGMECGISLEKYNDIKNDDVIEVYIQKEIKQTISAQ
ncbi:translation initiation factor IF-2 [Magnetofaba australis]|uniref:Translation initiation factor IF-2 n=1 Tax=Magnetofaba australis IT-1 TaxID=1434232 RepID=A0A1Y2JZL0_9PROT|nr:translation initiation factor IF-2 [Magnetofaba australis]OSM00360.1 putative translation initiation factor 2 [Magnetofaba australis IT-1]